MNLEQMYDWSEMQSVLDEFLPEWIGKQKKLFDEPAYVPLPSEKEEKIRSFDFPEKGRDSRKILRFLTDDVYPYRWKNNHPKYLTFIPGAFVPAAVLGDYCNNIVNPYASCYELSPGTTILEDKTLRFLGKSLGFDEDRCGGQFVSGGSIANLTGMILARDHRLDPHKLLEGRIYTSDQAHSSVKKAAKILGFLPEQVISIPTDEQFRIIPEELDKAIDRDKTSGFSPFLVVATSGTTNTGAIDPLSEIGSICQKHHLWLHIDGAYGASIIFSSYAHLLKGIELADSVSFDGHKWLSQTYGCSAIVVKDRKYLFDSFHTNPEYLREVAGSDTKFNFWDMGIEMTRPARGMSLWFTFQVLGLENIKRMIDQCYKPAEWIYDYFKGNNNWELFSGPQMAIINLRFSPNGWTEEQKDVANRQLSKRVLADGKATVLTTELRGKKVLRFCTNHPLLKREELEEILCDIQHESERLLRQYPNIV